MVRIVPVRRSTLKDRYALQRLVIGWIHRRNVDKIVRRGSRSSNKLTSLFQGFFLIVFHSPNCHCLVVASLIDSGAFLEGCLRFSIEGVPPGSYQLGKRSEANTRNFLVLTLCSSLFRPGFGVGSSLRVLFCLESISLVLEEEVVGRERSFRHIGRLLPWLVGGLSFFLL